MPGFRRRASPDHRFQLAQIRREAANALGELLGRHGILVQRPAEGGFIHGDPSGFLGCRSLGGIEHAGEHALILRELIEQRRRDGQAIAARKRLDLADIAEGRAHHHRVVAMRLVIGVDRPHGEHTGSVSLV